jgi:hypothetical protein
MSGRPGSYSYARSLAAAEPGLAPEQRQWLIDHAEFANSDLRASRLRQWLCDHLERTAPAEGQRLDTRLGTIEGWTTMKLLAGDIEAAEKLAKAEGITLAKALAIYSALNIANTPSYAGGTLISKKGDSVKKSSKKAAKAVAKAAEFAVNYRMTANSPDDLTVFKALYTTRRPAVGDRALVDFLRHGRP